MMSKLKSKISFPALFQSYPPYLLTQLEPFLSSHPHWQLAFYLAIGLYGVYLALKQEELLEIVEFIKKHPDEFQKEIVQGEEFKKGFLVFFENYLKERLKHKREMLKTVLIDFTVSEDKENFELERLNDCFSRISLNGLKHLVFIKKEILPLIEKEVQADLANMTYSPTESDRLIDGIKARKPVSNFITTWIHENYNINSKKVQEQYGLENASNYPQEVGIKIANKEHKVSKEKSIPNEELVSLGLMKIRIEGGGGFGGGASSSYNLTDFGYKFIEYLDKEVNS